MLSVVLLMCTSCAVDDEENKENSERLNSDTFKYQLGDSVWVTGVKVGGKKEGIWKIIDSTQNLMLIRKYKQDIKVAETWYKGDSIMYFFIEKLDP